MKAVCWEGTDDIHVEHVPDPAILNQSDAIVRVTDARVCFARAAEMGTNDTLTCAEALRAYAVLCRRARQYDDAAVAWRQILELSPPVPHLAHEASDALAVHHEHRLRDFQMARRFALQSLGFNISPTRTEAIHHRLTRLHRKLGSPPPDAVPLF